MKPIILIPMAGNGSRFAAAGYTLPKPLIDVNGKPMIERVINCFNNVDADYIFIVQQHHIDKYDIDKKLNLIKPNSTIISTGAGVTEGAACTVLLATKFINNDRPLIVVNSDNLIEWRVNLDEFLKSNSDGLILTHYATEPIWSFVKVDINGYVTEVAEKNPISSLATSGVYIWKQGKNFVNAAIQMIKKNIRTNNEFYVAPVFNENVLFGHNISTVPTNMWGIGTPDELKFFLDNNTLHD